MSNNLAVAESSWIRIRNQVIINVCSAVGTTVCLAILAGVLSGLALLAQLVFHFVVIPTNLLVALFFIGVGMFIVLLIIAIILGLVHRWLGKHPAVLIAVLLGVFSVLIALHLQSSSTGDELKEALKKVEESAKAQAAQHPPPSPEKGAVP